MTKRKTSPGNAHDLRRRADDKARETYARMPENLDAMTKVEHLVHELRVHQIELEMQNEELRRAQFTLEETRDKYIDLYDFSPVGYFTFTREALIKEVNLTGAALLAVERQKLINARFRRFVAPEDCEKWDQHLISVFELGGKQSCDLKLKRADGSLFQARLESIRLDVAGEATALRTVVSDITERKQAEELEKYRAHLEEMVAQRTQELAVLNEQLQQSQKIEAVGLLAGGIAHEFNNILTTIKGSMHLIVKKLQAASPVTKYTEQITSSINKASSLCHDLLAFSRKQTITLRPIDFNGIIHKGTDLLSQVIGEHIEMTMILTDKNPTVMADTNQLEQVLLNLASNARDAMPGGGKLSIQTDVVEIDEGFQKEHGFGTPGTYVLLTVSDTGVGMEEKIKEKMFEPFFTTKALGKGSGLGLAVTYGIVKQHNGFIDVETTPGKGTTFRIYLPTVEAKAVQPDSRPIAPPTGGRETILLAEDDADTRETMREVLQLSGYSVIEAGDGEDAVRVFTDKKDQIDLVFLDVRMPKKNGREVYEEIKKVSPSTAVLFMSGYTKDIIDSQGIIEEKLNFISKTATPEEILRKLREVLDK